MINKQRVHRIKNLIYAFMILILLLPVILMVILSFKILDTNREIIKRLDGFNSSVSQNAIPGSPSPDGGYVIEPDQQDFNSSQPEENASGGDSNKTGLNNVSQDENAGNGADVNLYLGSNELNKDLQQNTGDSHASDINIGVGGMQPVGGDSDVENGIPIHNSSISGSDDNPETGVNGNPRTGR